MSGRNLMHHGLAVIEAWVPENVASHQGAVGGALYTAEFAESDHETRGCVNGFTMVTGSRLTAPDTRRADRTPATRRRGATPTTSGFARISGTGSA